MNKSDEKDLNLGIAIGRGCFPAIVTTLVKVPSNDARVRFWVGIFSALAGAAMQSIGREDAAMALKAAAQAVSAKERP